LESGDQSEQRTLAEAEVEEQQERLRAELGDNEGYVVLMRRTPAGKLATLAKIPADAFSTEYVMQRYGGGFYVAKFFQYGLKVSEGGYKGSTRFEIDQAVLPTAVPPPQAGAGSAATEGPQPWIAAALDKLAEAVKELKAAPVQQASQLDTMKLIEGIANAARSLAPPSLPPAPAQPDLEKQLALIEKVVNVGTRIIDARSGSDGGSADSGDLYAMAMMRVADPLIEIIKDKIQEERRLKAGATVMPAAMAPRAASPPLPASAPSQPAEANMLPPWLIEVRRLVPLILSRLKRNVSAENTAFFVLDDLSDATKERIAELAVRDDFEQQVMRFLPPQLATNPAWAQEFVVAMRDYLLGDEGDQEEEAPDDLGGARGGKEASNDEPATDPVTEALRTPEAVS